MTPEVRAIKQARSTGKAGDLATLARNIAFERVETGDIQPTLAEGLRAQEALDRRAEKGADRDLMLVMAQVIGGAIPYKVEVLEGQWTQLDAEREADEAELRQLGDGDVSDRLAIPATYRRPN
jgi:hypothetical protein